MIGKYIYSTLRANTDITDIVADRIFPLKGDASETLPAIVYILESEENMSPPGMATMSEFTVRISLYGNDYIELDDLADYVGTSLDESPVSPTGHVIEAAYLMDSDDGFDHEINAYSRDLVFRILTHKTA